MSFHLDDLVDLMKSEEKPSSSRNTAKKASVLFFSFGVKACSDQKIGMNDIMVLENGFYSSGFFLAWARLGQFLSQKIGPVQARPKCI